VRDVPPPDLLRFYGVPEHLRAILIHDDGTRHVIQQGRR
jgi:hypothetical protein